MSYGVMPYRVDFKALMQVRGSGNRQLIETIRAEALEDGEDDDAPGMVSGPDAGGEDPFAIERAAARTFVDEGTLPEDPDLALTVYGTFVEAFGFPLDFFKIPEHAAVLDAVATQAPQVALRALFGMGSTRSGAPPHPEVTIGQWTAAQAHEARGLLTKVKVPAKAVKALARLDKAIAAAAAKRLGIVATLGKKGELALVASDVERLAALPRSRNAIALVRFDYCIESGEEGDPDQYAVPDADFSRWSDEQAGRGAEPTVATAAAQIINGERLRGDGTGIFALALHAIVQQIATPLDNAAVYPSTLDHFRDVDAALAGKGLDAAISMTELVSGGAPFALPAADDFPTVGHMTPEAVTAARGRISGEDWSAAPVPVRETLRLIDRWIADAAAVGEGLICFYQ